MDAGYKKIFGFILGIVYIAVGVFCYFKIGLEKPWREILMILFLMYGSWRLYRAYSLKTE